jgi:hypothetical protein
LSLFPEKKFILVTKEAPKPPYLEIKEYSFTDTDGNNKIDAGETAIINSDLYNLGTGPGLGLKLNMKEINLLHCGFSPVVSRIVNRLL